MDATTDLTGWTIFLLGCAALFAGIGALRTPNQWRTMVTEIERSPALQFVCGMLELLIGAIVYLANPWVPADLLACIGKAMGGLMMLEAFIILGFCDIYSQMWVRTLANMQRGWATVTVASGLGLIVAGIHHLG